MVSIGIELSTEEYLKTPLYIRILHNIRNLPTKNSIFSTENNFHILNEEFEDEGILSIEDMKEYFIQEEEYLKKVVKQKLKQKSQNKLHIVESLISISDDSESENLTKEDIEKKIKVYLDHLKKKGIKIYSVSYHEDEGIYIDIESGEVIDHLEEGFKYDSKTMEIKKNKHIHIIHSNISLDTGRSYTNEIYRETEQYNKDNRIDKFIKNEKGKMKPNPLFKKGLSLLQDKISECFGMRRGILNSENKHKDIKTFKNDKKNESKLIKQIKEYYETIIKSKDTELEKKNLKITELETENLELKNKIKILEEIIEGYKNKKETIINNKELDNETKKSLHKYNKSIFDLCKKILSTNNFKTDTQGTYLKDKNVFIDLIRQVDNLNILITSNEILQPQKEIIIKQTEKNKQEEENYMGM